jgi:hypothetical protein
MLEVDSGPSLERKMDVIRWKAAQGTKDFYCDK